MIWCRVRVGVRVSTYVLKYKEVIQMIRNNISTFLNTTNSRWPPKYFVKRSLKNPENKR